MKYKILPSSTNLYFTSSVISGHKSIFLTENFASIVLNSLTWLRRQGYWKLYAFCVMPNHLHLVVRVMKSISVEKLLFKFHSFTAHEIAEALKRNNKVKLLEFFSSAALEKKSDRKYLIWESSLVRPIETEEVMCQS